MIKAGLFGWLNTLPLGVASLPWWSVAIMTTGLTAAFGGALLGVHQRTPKTVLAYSSISQMGLITVAVGAGMQAPALWPLLSPAVALYALHHGLAKGALFLGVGIARHSGGHIGRVWLWIALTLPGLSLGGLVGSGIAAKLTLKQALASPQTPAWWNHLPWLMGLAAIGTTALVLRYLWLLRGQDHGDRASRSVWLGWAMLLVAGSLCTFALPALGLAARSPASVAELLDLAWPVIAGIVLALLLARRLGPWEIPAGDLLGLIVLAGAKLMRGSMRTMAPIRAIAAPRRPQTPASARIRPDLSRRHAFLEHFWRRNAALIFIALLVVLLTALLAGGIPVMPDR